MSSFTRKRINVAFRLGGPVPAGGAANTIVSKGLRVSCNISDTGGAQPVASLRVYGLSLSWLNLLSTIGKPRGSVNSNSITITAGDDESGMMVVFVGNIQVAYADLNESPNSPLIIQAMTGALARMQAIPSQNYPGSADVATMLAGLATQMNFRFQNYGVNSRLSDQTLEGTAMQQIDKIISASGIEASFDNGTVTIWPKGGSKGGFIPLISKETGMIGSPRYYQYGVSVDCEFNPQITVGTKIQVKSIITPASGHWPVLHVEHRLESEVPNGQWVTHADCGYPTVYGA